MSEKEKKAMDVDLLPLNYSVPGFDFREPNDVNRFTVPGFNYAEDTKGLVNYFRDKQKMNSNHQNLINTMTQGYDRDKFGEFLKSRRKLGKRTMTAGASARMKTIRAGWENKRKTWSKEQNDFWNSREGIAKRSHLINEIKKNENDR